MDRHMSAALDRHITGNYGEDQANEPEQQGPRIIAENHYGTFVEISASLSDYGSLAQTIAHFNDYGGVDLYEVSTGSEPRRFTLTGPDMEILIAAYQQHVAKVREAEAVRRAASDDLPF